MGWCPPGEEADQSILKYKYDSDAEIYSVQS